MRGSLPTRGAWIEMLKSLWDICPVCKSLPTRGAWIEIFEPVVDAGKVLGRSPRGERG